jgi:hypothetical protein
MGLFALGALGPQAVNYIAQASGQKETPFGKGLTEGASSGITTGATVGQFAGPQVAIIAGLVVGLKTFLDTLNKTERELSSNKFEKSTDKLEGLYANEAELRKKNNKQFEQDVRNATALRRRVQGSQYINIFKATGEERSQLGFQTQQQEARTGERIANELKTKENTNLSKSDKISLANFTLGPNGVAELQKEVEQQFKQNTTGGGIVNSAIDTFGVTVDSAVIQFGRFLEVTTSLTEAEKRAALQADIMSDKLEKIGDEAEKSGKENNGLFRLFARASQDMNIFTEAINNTTSAMAFARASIGDFDTSLNILTGNSNIKASTSRLTNLQNAGFLDSNTFQNTIKSIVPNVSSDKLQQLDMNRVVSAQLPAAIERNTRGGALDVANLQSELASIQLNNQFIGDTQSGKALLATIVQSLNEAIESNKGIIKPEQFEALAQEATKGSQRFIQSLQSLEQERIAVEQQWIDGVSNILRAQAQTRQSELRTLDVGAQGAKTRREVEFSLGRTSSPNISKLEALANLTNKQNITTGYTGGGVTNPVAITNEIRRLMEQVKIDSAKLKSSEDTNERQVLSAEIQKNIDTIGRLDAGLENLITRTDELSAAQAKLSELESIRGQARSVAEQYITGSNSDRRKLLRDIATAEGLRRRQMGGENIGAAEFDASVRQSRRGSVFSLFSSMGGLGEGGTTFGMTGNSILDDVVRSRIPTGDRLLKGIDKAGGDVGDITRKQKLAADEKVRLDKEKEQEYTQTVLDKQKEFNNAFQKNIENLQRTVGALVDASINIKAEPITVILQGDTALSNLEPLIKSFINDAIGKTLNKTADSALPPNVANSRNRAMSLMGTNHR